MTPDNLRGVLAEAAAHIAELQAYIDRMPYPSDVDDAYERGRAEQAAADWARVEAVWPDPFGKWTAEQAEAARAMKDALRAALDSEGGEDRG
jgi:hypothetical protein